MKKREYKKPMIEQVEMENTFSPIESAYKKCLREE